MISRKNPHFWTDTNYKGETMDKWLCIPCDYIYDPEEGDPEANIMPGTAFEDLPDDLECPICGVGKEEFEKVE